MTKECLISKQELDSQTKHYIEITYGSDYCKKLYGKPRKQWDDDEVSRYKNARSTTYCRLRTSLKKKTAKMWIETLTAGNLKPWLNKHGIAVSRYYNGDTQFSCKKLANYLVRFYIENTLIPSMEKELNITGVKMTKNTSACCQNCLDFSRAKTKESK